MRERPILFSGEMVRSIIAGNKTQTRRIMRNQPKEGHSPIYIAAPPQTCLAAQLAERSPYFIGDHLYVRETIRPIYMEDMADGVEYRADGARRVANVEYLAEGCGHHKCNLAFNWNAGIEEGWDEKTQTNNQKWIPAIHMPKWATRIWLEVTNVRVERLKEITNDECKREGLRGYPNFAAVWVSCYGSDSFNANPWVWVVEFKKIEVIND